MPQSQHASAGPALVEPPARTPALLRCCQARDCAIRAAQAQGCSDYEAQEAGNKAFREALPDLSTHSQIRDFISCVVYAMAIEVIDAMDASKLLYGAQVAVGALHRAPKDAHPPAA